MRKWLPIVLIVLSMYAVGAIRVADAPPYCWEMVGANYNACENPDTIVSNCSIDASCGEVIYHSGLNDTIDARSDLDTDTWWSIDTTLLNTSDVLGVNLSIFSVIYYNATQYAIIEGSVDAGALGDTQHQDGNYDGVTFNFSEVAGSPGLDLRMNFTDVEDFNTGVMRYKTSLLAGDFPIIQLWGYDTSDWEDYPVVPESLTFATIEQPVFDSSAHLNNSLVQMRIYKASNGNINNHYFIDWVAISKGFGTPSGEEVDPVWQVDKSDYYNMSRVNETIDARSDFDTIVSNCSVNGSCSTLAYWDIAVDTFVDTDTIVSNCSGNGSCGNVAYWDIVSDTFSDTIVSNCSGNGSCGNIAYWDIVSDTFSDTIVSNCSGNGSCGNLAYWDIAVDTFVDTDTIVSNCTGNGSCVNVAYWDIASDTFLDDTIVSNCTGNGSCSNIAYWDIAIDTFIDTDTIVSNCTGNGSCSDVGYWDIIDDTFAELGGDTFTGNMYMQKSLLVNTTLQVGDALDNALQISWDNTLFYFSPSNNAIDIDGTLVVDSLDTGQGQHELFAMDQDVEQADTVIFAVVDTPLIQDAADITIDPGGGNILSGGDLTVKLGSAAEKFIDIYANRILDNDDTLTVESEDDIVLLMADKLFIRTDGAGTTDQLNFRSSSAGTVIYPGTDNEGTVGVAGNRFADVVSVLINGADYCFANNICMTEYVNENNQIDIAFVYGKPTRDQARTIGLTIYENYSDYLYRHPILTSTTAGGEHTFTETEFNTRLDSVLIDGKLDFTFDRTVRMTLRDVAKTMTRLDSIEQTLCNNGVQKYC